METISLLEATRLELAGAERRLDLAARLYRDFVAEHCVVIDGLAIYRPSPTVEMRVSLDHERVALEIELDAARRRHAECLAQFIELKKTGGV
jgi:hypothetical protein